MIIVKIIVFLITEKHNKNGSFYRDFKNIKTS